MAGIKGKGGAKGRSGGARNGAAGRLLSPAVTLAKIEKLAAQLQRREQIKGWSLDEVEAVAAALDQLAAPVKAERFDRWQRRAEED